MSLPRIDGSKRSDQMPGRKKIDVFRLSVHDENRKRVACRKAVMPLCFVFFSFSKRKVVGYQNRSEGHPEASIIDDSDFVFFVTLILGGK